MKKLSIQEKAKAYDKAIEIAKSEYQTHKSFNSFREMLIRIFPELKESEDERIRKWLITQLELKSDVNNPHDLELMILKSIAWLEKQGEQKPITIDIDKMVSKYSHTKDGDFGLPVNCQIRAYRQGINDALNLSLGIKKQGEQKPYGQREECLDCQFNYEGFCVMKRCEQKPVIEMKSAEESLGIDSDTYNEIVDECIYGEQKLTDKVEPKLDEIEIPFGVKDSELQEAFYHIPKGFHAEIEEDKVVIKRGEHNSAWSEEDTETLNGIVNYLFTSTDVSSIEGSDKWYDWLKSLKSRKLCIYNPYKAVVESIAKMCNKYENCISNEKEAKDFLANVAVKCREAAEYDKKYMEE